MTDPHEWDERTRLRVESAFCAYTRLEGLQEAFYEGVESRNCEGTIPNEYPKDDPKHRTLERGVRSRLRNLGTE